MLICCSSICWTKFTFLVETPKMAFSFRLLFNYYLTTKWQLQSDSTIKIVAARFKIIHKRTPFMDIHIRRITLFSKAMPFCNEFQEYDWFLLNNAMSRKEDEIVWIAYHLFGTGFLNIEFQNSILFPGLNQIDPFLFIKIFQILCFRN